MASCGERFRPKIKVKMPSGLSWNRKRKDQNQILIHRLIPLNSCEFLLALFFNLRSEFYSLLGTSEQIRQLRISQSLVISAGENAI